MSVPSVEYVPTECDFANAQRLHSKHHPLVRGLSNLLFYGLTAFAFLYLVYVVVLINRCGTDEAFKHFVSIGIALSCVILVPVAATRRTNRQWETHLPIHLRDRPIVVHFDEATISFARADDRELRVHWCAVTGYEEDDKTVLLYMDSKHFLYIPKRYLDEPAMNQLRAFANRREAKEEHAN